MSKRKKQIVVIGLGHFGRELALSLRRSCEVLAIDRSPEAINEISAHVQSARALDVADEAALASVIPEDVDEAVVSMGGNLEGSILCTLYLKRLGVPLIRVKALSDDHAVVLQQVGATEVIFPERETARRVAAHINNPNLLDFVPLGSGYQVTEMKLPADLEGYSLAEVGLRSRFNVFVIIVRRGASDDMEFLPGPDLRLREGDVLVLIGRDRDLLKLQQTSDMAPPEQSAAPR